MLSLYATVNALLLFVSDRKPAIRGGRFSPYPSFEVKNV